MVALGLMGFKSHYQVSQALTVTELSKHQSKELIPAGEMLDIMVSIVLVNKTAELVIVQKLYQLGEYIFVFVHLAVNLSAKLQIQIVALYKLVVNDFISAISKNN